MKKIDKILILSLALLVIAQAVLFYSFSHQKKYQPISAQAPLNLNTSASTSEVLEKEFEKSNIEIPEPAEEKNLSALFFGDMMLDRYVARIIKTKKVSGLFSELAGEENKFFSGFDIVSANLEGAVTDKGAHYPPALANDFAFAPETIGETIKYGFNFFNIANNHLSDQGKRGADETRKNLDQIGVNYSGCIDREIADCSSKIMRFESTSVAMIGFSSVYGALDRGKVSGIVSNAKKNSDIVIVNMHWGKEYSHDFSKSQSDMAHSIIDAGADIIIGHHPHVIQGMEIYKDRPIFYSLGNFIFDQYFSKDTQVGLAVGVFIEGKEIIVHLFPLISRQSIPRLAVGDTKAKILSDLVKWSKAGSQFEQMIKEEAVRIKLK